MRLSRNPILGIIVLGILLAGSITLALFAFPGKPPKPEHQNFRIDSKVFASPDSQSTGQTTTLFFNGVVYNFASGPEEITIFDPAGGRFVLLNPAHKIKTILSTSDLMERSNQLKAWCAKQDDPFLRFAANPQFEERFNHASGELILGDPVMTYRIKTVGVNEELILRQYQAFSDGFARLSVMPGSIKIPPFPRIQVNSALFRRHRIPEQVDLEIPAQRSLGGVAISMRSQHTMVWRLDEPDLEKIRQAQRYEQSFQSVSFRQFHNPSKVEDPSR